LVIHAPDAMAADADRLIAGLSQRIRCMDQGDARCGARCASADRIIFRFHRYSATFGHASLRHAAQGRVVSVPDRLFCFSNG
jgi:hypothetical protein